MLFIFAFHLANASLATTDVLLCATFLLPRWAQCGGRCASRCCKTMLGQALPWGWPRHELTGLPFSAGCAFVFAAYLWSVQRTLPRLWGVCLAFGVMGLTIWAIYRFQVGPMATNPTVAPSCSIWRQAWTSEFYRHGRRRPCTGISFLPGAGVPVNPLRPASGYMFGQTYQEAHWYFSLFMFLVRPHCLCCAGLGGLVVDSQHLARVRILLHRARDWSCDSACHVDRLRTCILEFEHAFVLTAFLSMLGALAAQRFVESRSLLARKQILAILLAWTYFPAYSRPGFPRARTTEPALPGPP